MNKLIVVIIKIANSLALTAFLQLPMSEVVNLWCVGCNWLFVITESPKGLPLLSYIITTVL